MSDMQHSRDMADAHADRELELADRARRAEWDAAETAEMHEESWALRKKRDDAAEMLADIRQTDDYGVGF